MALIIDPDLLAQGTEVTITTATKKITLNIAGDLSTDGVTLKCLYSFLKEEWKSDDNLIKFPFPMTPITDEQFEFVNGWDLYDDSSKYLIRTGGWALKDSGGVSQEEWAGVVTLGSLGASDQVYFQQENGGSAADFELTGAVNQAIKVYGDGTHGDIDYRSYLKLLVREYAKTYASAALTDIGVTTMTYQVYRFPLANGTDLKVTHDDTAVGTTSPWKDITITWYAAAQSRQIGASSYNFHIIIDAKGTASAEEIYERVQYELRLATDIDDGAGNKVGQIQPDMVRFVGSTLYTILSPEGGIYIDNFEAADTNRLVFVDDNGDEQTFPYVAALTVNLGENLVSDTAAVLFGYFTNDDAGDNLGYDYGTENAIPIQINEKSASATRAVTDDVATIETATAHGLQIGDGVNVTGMTDATYDGDFIVLSVPDSTTFTYALVHTDETETADTAGDITRLMIRKVNGNATIQFSYNYDNNDQRGTASKGTPAPVTFVALGLSTAQFVKATGTIAESISNSISLVSPLERNYQNPA